MVSKNSWLRIRESGNMDLEHIHYGLNLDPKIDMSIDKLQFNMNILQKSPFFSSGYRKILIRIRSLLDKHFSITILEDSEGNEIWQEVHKTYL